QRARTAARTRGPGGTHVGVAGRRGRPGRDGGGEGTAGSRSGLAALVALALQELALLVLAHLLASPLDHAAHVGRLLVLAPRRFRTGSGPDEYRFRSRQSTSQGRER